MRPGDSQHQLGSDRLATWAVLLIAALSLSLSINANLFVAGGTDSSGYISAADLWRRAEVHRPEPLAFWPAWPHTIDSTAPVGYRPGPIRGTEVQVYPFGFPLLIAAATAIGGPLAAHLVAPVMGALLVLCTFALGRLIAGNLAGLVAAVLVAASPITLFQMVDAMSDVPAAACWAGAWLLAARGTVGGSATAGLLAALAMTMRPNLAPLAIVVATVACVAASSRGALAEKRRWWAAAAFIAAAAMGPALVLWSQSALYGNAVASGYPGQAGFFALAHVLPNAALYLRLLATTHTLVPLVGLFLVPLVIFRPGTAPLLPAARLMTLSAAALLLCNYALYLPYLPFDHWPFLRFLLPGLVALFVLYGSLTAYLTHRVALRSRWLAAAVPIAALAIVFHGLPLARYALNDWRAQARVRLLGHYLDAALPETAAVFAAVHSGSVAHYTGRDIVRLDLIDPAALDQTIDALARRGRRPVFVLDQALEFSAFQQRFGGSRFGRLDWAPRAVFTSTTSVWYLDAADLAGHRGGERWPIDVLQ